MYNLGEQSDKSTYTTTRTVRNTDRNSGHMENKESICQNIGSVEDQIFTAKSRRNNINNSLIGPSQDQNVASKSKMAHSNGQIESRKTKITIKLREYSIQQRKSR